MSCFYKNRFLLFCLLTLGMFMISAQEEKAANQHLIDQYKAYFTIPRKSIHLHLNKTTFVSGEQIWFSTYVYNKKEEAISLEEEYISIDLINSLGEIVSSKTVLHSNNSGFNDILLADDLPSGVYYIQAYTTAMQELIEDDSSVYKIKVLNFDTAPSAFDGTETLEEIQIEIQAESGHLLDGVLGTCALRISDSNNEPVVPDKVILESTKGAINTAVSINDIGIGRFSFIPRIQEQHQVKVYIGDKVFTQQVPSPKLSGYTISTDYNYGKDLLLVTINSKTQRLEQEISLLIHKDGNLIDLPVRFKNQRRSAEIIIPVSSLFKGVNTLSLAINNEVYAERLVFAHPDNATLSSQLLNVERQNDSMIIYIKNNSTKLQSVTNNLSLSVLPQKSLADSEYRNIPSSFFLNGIIPHETISQLQEIPFVTEDSAKYILDNVLMLKGWGPYKWKNIKNPNLIPVKRITALSQISGYVNLFDTENDSLSVMLYSKDNGLFETTLLNQEKKFLFDNLILAKGSKFTLTLLNKKGLPVYANFFFTTLPIDEKFRHIYRPKHEHPKKQSTTTTKNPNLLFKEVEQLEEVTVIANRLKYEKFFGRYDGRKIDSTLIAKGTLENYIRSYGFKVIFVNPLHPDPTIAGTLQFAERCRRSDILSPSLVIDGVFYKYAMNQAFLRLEFIDEIYYRSGRCKPSTFVVFTNDKYKDRNNREALKDAKEFIVENGHDLSSAFTRPNYHSTSNSSFEHYGIISWIPKIVSNKEGVISFKVPVDGQEKLKLQLQGFSENGDLISNELTIDLSKR